MDGHSAAMGVRGTAKSLSEYFSGVRRVHTGLPRWLDDHLPPLNRRSLDNTLRLGYAYEI